MSAPFDKVERVPRPRPGLRWRQAATAPVMPARSHRRHGVSLFARLFAVNAAVLIAAVLLLALTPATVSAPIAPAEAAVLGVGLLAMLLLNLVLIRSAVAPLERLARLMGKVDPLRPGARIEIPAGAREVRQLAESFNAMLEGLETERRESVRTAIAAQESERLRLARELHDEIGQTLTAVLLQLQHTARHTPSEVRRELERAQETVQAGLDDLRGVARRLRPEALDDLGLRTALIALASRVGEHTGLRVEHTVDPVLPALREEAELVVYRIAQEALTNAGRHAQADWVGLTVQAADDGGVVLRVRDDGRGLDGAGEGTGIRGMRERAVLVGADLRVGDRPEGGVEVMLRIPPHADAP